MARLRPSGLGLLVDVAVALLVLLLFELAVRGPLVEVERRNTALSGAPAASGAAPDGFRALVTARDPAAFVAGLRGHQGPVVVLAGDSQGLVVKDTTGLVYPRQVARALAGRHGGAAVVGLHLGGANTFEQGTLLLALLHAGVRPATVVWAHSIFSLRKNEIRAELVPLYRSLPEAETGRPAVILVGGAAGPDDSGARRPLLEAVTGHVEEALSASALVRFSRRELWQKSAILWAGPLGRLVPPGLRPRTAAFPDPPDAMLEASARFAGQVTGVLRARGVRVVSFLSPIDFAADPRPFGAHTEAVAYPALERAVRAGGGELHSWVGLLPHEHYGRYADGSTDAFHLGAAGHDTLATRILGVLEGGGVAAPAPPAPAAVALTPPRAPAPPR